MQNQQINDQKFKKVQGGLGTIINIDTLRGDPIHAPAHGGAPKVAFKQPVYSYYRADSPELEGNVNRRNVLFLGMYRSGDTKLTPERTASWIFSLLELVFPGIVKKIYTDADRQLLIPVDYMPEELAAIIRDRPRNVGPDGKVPSALNLVQKAFHPLPFAATATSEEILAILITLIFAIGKVPTDNNRQAFAVNRPKAILGSRGKVFGEGWLNEANMPALDAYRNVYGFFSIHDRIRRTLVDEFIRWVSVQNLPPDMRSFVSMIRLWETAGITHVVLIQKFIDAYGDILVLMPALHPEIRTFVHGLALAGAGNIRTGYSKVVDGDRRTPLFSRNFPELLKLAREMARRQDPRFGNYAQGLGPSAFLASFTAIADDLKIPLPEAGVIEANIAVV